MTGQQKLALWVAILASFVAFLDMSVVNVALPAIQDDLGGGLSTQQWVVDAYLITLGSLILIAGSLSDLFGRKRVMYYGLLGFGITSLLCALAPTAPLLVSSRALQGAAGALLVPSSLALIMTSFAGKQQGKAIGKWTAWTGIAFIVGPLLGGFLVDSASWRLVFAINVVPIAVTLWLLAKVEQKPAAREKPSIDIKGSLLCALGLGSLVYALIEQPNYGWTAPRIIIPLVLGIAVLIIFVLYERETEHPMLPLSLFKHHNFSIGNISTLAVYAGLTAGTFLVIVYLQQVGGYSAIAAGMALVPITLLLFLMSSRFGGLAGKYGPRFFMGAGPIIAGIGFLLFLRLGAQPDYWSQIFPAVLIFGLGLSMTVAPLTTAILGDVGSERAGIASAVNNAVARVAGLVAVAVIGAVVAAQFAAAMDKTAASQPPNPALSSAIEDAKSKPLEVSVPSGLPNGSQFKSDLQAASVTAFHSGVLAVSGLMLAGGAISALWIRNPAKNKLSTSV
ncbi:MAG TPA: MFS transporter [Candidatus Saccharimonadales bacterium]|nr:MFS transporter [Candidatus Saccharimonadales bacterium]